jgi:hypothetical protein
MTYTAQDLVTRSWYLSGIIARNLQIPTGDQINDGLRMLNNLLDFKQIETDLIPYWTYIEIDAIPHQEYYFLPFVAAIECMTFNLGPVRYPMETVSRTNYFGSARVDNISTLPFSWNFNRGHGGGTLSLYFKPDQNYPIKMMTKTFLTDVSLSTDLSNAFNGLSSGFVSGFQVTYGGTGYNTTPTVTITGSATGDNATAIASVSQGVITGISLVYSGSNYTEGATITISSPILGGTAAIVTANVSSYRFIESSNQGYDTSYLEYLRYALAGMMCSEYGIVFNPESARILQKYERKLMFEEPPDLSIKKLSILQSGEQTGYNWGDVSIGRGWRP